MNNLRPGVGSHFAAASPDAGEDASRIILSFDVEAHDQIEAAAALRIDPALAASCGARRPVDPISAGTTWRAKSEGHVFRGRPDRTDRSGIGPRHSPCRS